MVDITGILRNGALKAKQVAPVEQQIIDAMERAGIEPPDDIYIDGQIRRFNGKTSGKAGKTDKPSWYVFYSGEVVSGAFGCWRAGVTLNFRQDIGRELTTVEQMALTRRANEAREAQEKLREKTIDSASSAAHEIWEGREAASDDHPYLKRKGIHANGARITGDGRLMLPIYDNNGDIKTLQYIDHEGVKRFHSGLPVDGGYYVIGAAETKDKIFLAEGFATAATIYETTQHPCIVAYSSSNIPSVASNFRNNYPDKKIVIVADNDDHGIGEKYARIAEKESGCTVIVSPHGDANDYHLEGGDLRALLLPPQNDWLISADDFCQQPAPIKWLVKGWLQKEALIMIHGPSGGGKTFVVLDWCLKIASGFEDWYGKKVRNGGVVYLAGEGHHGLKGRVAAWKEHNKPSHPIQLWLSKSGCDLNTATGYNKVIEQITSLPSPPEMIVVDTLHRFLDGDENSSQDAKTMLDSCNALMNKFNCSVVLVHHTGVSEEAQHRARGSSAWRGALDIEISVCPLKSGSIKLIQRKSKDAEETEPKLLRLESVQIPGWFDEDEEPVCSAVIIESDETEEEPAKKKPAKEQKLLEKYRKIISDAMLICADKKPDGYFITITALRNYLIDEKGYSETSARKMLKPSVDDGFADILSRNNIVKIEQKLGWTLVDDDLITKVNLVNK